MTDVRYFPFFSWEVGRFGGVGALFGVRRNVTLLTTGWDGIGRDGN